MTAVSNIQQNSKVESQFLQIDYLLLILSLTGFGFVFLCLIVIFVRRNLRNRKENSPGDAEMELLNNAISSEHEYFILKPVMQQNNEIHNSTDESRRVSSCDKMNQSFEKDEISENKDLNDIVENSNMKSPYKTAHEELFHYMYPQYPLYNVFQSPNTTPGLVKPSILITEITSEDERNFKTTVKENNNSVEINKLSKEDLSNWKKEESETIMCKYPRENPFNDYNKEFTDVVDEKLKLGSSNQNAETNSTEIHPINHSFTNNYSSNNSVDSEEDSGNDSTSSTSLQSTGSSNHIGTFKLKKAVPFRNLKDQSNTKTLSSGPSTKDYSSINLEKLDDELRAIDNKIKELPPINNLENINFHPDSIIQESVGFKFESLQNDITKFLDNTVSFEENESVQSILASDDIDITSNVLPQTFTPVQATQNEETANETFPSRIRQNFNIQSSGDNIHQDELLNNSTEQLPFIWPYNNFSAADTPSTSNIVLNSDSSLRIRKPLISSSDDSNLTENFIIKREYNSKYSVQNLKEISGSKFTKVFTDDKEVPFSFIMKTDDTDSDFDHNLFNRGKRSKNRNLKRSILNTFGKHKANEKNSEDESNTKSNSQTSITRKKIQINDASVSNPFSNLELDFPFIFQMKKENNGIDFERDSIENIDKDKNIEERNMNNTTDNGEKNEYLPSTILIQDDTKDVNKDLDDSLSSVDLHTNEKLTQQTNKNAFIDTKTESLRVHHFRGGNVKQTVKLFENVVTDTNPFEPRSPSRNKRQK